MIFAPHLIKWYDLEHRNLPWRETRDPYKIWISEIILQQTRVAQGVSYYIRFIEKYPDVKSLAHGSEQDILKLWQGLGYYSRARHLHQAARQIMEKHGGIFPAKYEDIIELKGVGEYTAAAVASIAYGIPVPVIDGNVIRVVTRLFDIAQPGRSSEVIRKIRNILEDAIPQDRPGDFNQAMMELGARICVPKNPSCTSCVLKENCLAYKNNTVATRPVKENRNIIRHRFFNYFVFLWDDNEGAKTIIRRRSDKDIWRNLFDFPVIETNSPDTLEKIFHSQKWQDLTGNTDFHFLRSSRFYRHKLSHQYIQACFHIMKGTGEVIARKDKDMKIINLSDIQLFPVSRLIEQYLRDENF